MAGTYNGPDQWGTPEGNESTSWAELDANKTYKEQAAQNIINASNGGQNTVVSADGERVLYQPVAPAAPTPHPSPGVPAAPTAPVPHPAPVAAPVAPTSPMWPSIWNNINIPNRTTPAAATPQGPLFNPGQRPAITETVRPDGTVTRPGQARVEGMPQGARPGVLDSMGMPAPTGVMNLWGTQVSVNIAPTPFSSSTTALVRSSSSQQSSAPGAIKIRAGDTVGSLAKASGMTVQQFAQTYGIKDVNKVYAGQTLTPGGGGTALDAINTVAPKSVVAPANAAGYAPTNGKFAFTDQSATYGSTWNFGEMKTPKNLVIHHTAGRGDTAGVINTFKQRGFPAHYVIDRQGNITQVLGGTQKGQHVKVNKSGIVNSNSWGVEVIAKDDSDILPVQIEAAKQLATQLKNTYGFDYSNAYGHGQIEGQDKQATEGKTIADAIRAL